MPASVWSRAIGDMTSPSDMDEADMDVVGVSGITGLGFSGVSILVGSGRLLTCLLAG